jgi:hypothetical protein
MRADTLTDLTMLIVAFRRFANAPNKTYSLCAVVRKVITELLYRSVNSQIGWDLL